MTITSLKFSNLEETSINVTTETGSYSAPWPCYTWHAQEIQAAIDAGLSIEPFKTKEEVLSEAKEQIWEQIKAYRKERIMNGGFKVTVDGTTKWFYSDADSRTQYNTLSNAGIGQPDLSIPNWKTMDGTLVTITVALANEIQLHGIIQEATTFACAEGHRVAALASTDPLEYNYKTGWPVIFGE